MQPSQFQGSHELHVHVPRETTHAPSQHYQALTANGLTSTCKQNPIGPVPLHTPTNDCSLQVQGDNGAIPTQQNHQSPSLLPHELTNNTSTLQAVEPPALLQMGFQTLHWQQGCPHMQGSIGMMPVEMPAVTLQAIKQSPNFRGSHELHVHALNVHPPLSKH